MFYKILLVFLAKAIIVLMIAIVCMLGQLSIEGMPRVVSIEHYYLHIVQDKGDVILPHDIETFKKLAKEMREEAGVGY